MARLRAMIIVSEEKSAEAVSKIVRSFGHSSVKAQNQEQALVLLPAEKIDYFVLGLFLQFFEGDKAEYQNGFGLIDLIRDYYPKFLEYPIIVFTDSLVEINQLKELMEAGANYFLPFKTDDSEDKAIMARTIRRLSDKAVSKRKSKPSDIGFTAEINPDLILKKLASKYKLVVDVKRMEVFFNGIKLASGKDGLQQRHKIFLFVLARNLDKAMSHEEIRKEVRKYKLDESTDPPRSIRNKIRKSLRNSANKNPGKISEDEIKTFMKTVPFDLTRLTLEQNEVYTILNSDDYP